MKATIADDSDNNNRYNDDDDTDNDLAAENEIKTAMLVQ